MGERQPVGKALLRVLDLVVRAGLRGVWLRGSLPPGPFVWAANHHSWWDPFVAMAMLHRFGRRPSVLMRQENLDRFAFARKLGVFGTGERRHGLASLRAGRVLVIFPEGELRPAGPPGTLAHGAAWYAGQAGVPLRAVATRVIMRGQQWPEVYVSVAGWNHRPDETTAAVTAQLARHLADQLADLARLDAAADPREALPGFTPVMTGRRSWDERIDRLGWWWR